MYTNSKQFEELQLQKLEYLTAGLTFLATLLSTELFLSEFFADNANNSSMLYVTK